MSPEAAKGLLVDHRADIYSLGVIFYDVLTGRVPFEAPTPVEVLTKHITEAPVPPRQRRPSAEITEAAERLILKALAKEPDDRFQSMDELRVELQHCFGTVAYRRDAYRIPGLRESGVLPRIRRLTDELDEWLRQSEDVMAEATRRMQEWAASGAVTLAPEKKQPAVIVDGVDWDDLAGPVVEAGGDEAPLLLTKKKKDRA
jgi:serine/threonine-protein kinase